MLKLLAVGIGGFIGAIARYQISIWAQKATSLPFPLGTLTVNALGCFLIGILITLADMREVFSPELRLLLITGFLGSLTTFSTFGMDTFKLLEEGRYLWGMANMGANLTLGLAAVVAGRGIVRLLLA